MCQTSTLASAATRSNPPTVSTTATGPDALFSNATEITTRTCRGTAEPFRSPDPVRGFDARLPLGAVPVPLGSPCRQRTASKRELQLHVDLPIVRSRYSTVHHHDQPAETSILPEIGGRHVAIGRRIVGAIERVECRRAQRQSIPSACPCREHARRRTAMRAAAVRHSAAAFPPKFPRARHPQCDIHVRRTARGVAPNRRRPAGGFNSKHPNPDAYNSLVPWQAPQPTPAAPQEIPSAPDRSPS